MSLTSILTDKKNQLLRDKLKEVFPTPTFINRSKLQAPALTNNHSIIGTAFDYLLRFYIEYLNKTAIAQKGSWVADHAFKTLTKYLLSKKEIETGTNNLKVSNSILLCNIIESQHNQAKENYSKFILDGKLTDELIISTIFLAKLDLYVRTRIIDSNFDKHDIDDITDLRNLFNIINKENFISKSIYYLNPTFGKGSMLADGADADLIIDNTLIDIKVTMNFRLKREYFNQILCYYFLSIIGGVNSNKSDKPIEKIGIYFARHSELLIFPISSLGDTQKLESFTEWLISFLESSNQLDDNISSKDNFKSNSLPRNKLEWTMDLYNFVNNYKAEPKKPKGK
jgi:hypothetical protein